MSNVTFEFETPEGQKRAVIIPAENIKTTGPDGQPNPMMLVAAVLIQMDTRIRGLEQAQEMRLNALEFRLGQIEKLFEPVSYDVPSADPQAGLDEMEAPDIHNV